MLLGHWLNDWLEIIVGSRTKAPEPDFKVVITPGLLESSVRPNLDWGAQVLNPCTVCHHASSDHIVHRGEAICRTCSISCSRSHGHVAEQYRAQKTSRTGS